MYLRQAGLTRNPTFSYLYCVRCRGQRVASEAPLERKYSRWAILRVRISEIAFYKVLFSLFIYKVAEGTLEERR
jgi:hypothetical protein